MTLESARKTIIRNTMWGNANIAIRYLSSFVATVVIATNYSPEDFGTYQLLMTYLGIIEVVNLLHPTHLRNHLVSNPQDEGFVVKAWALQSFWIWVVISIAIVVFAVFSSKPLFWWLLLLGNIRMVFRVFDSTQILFDFRLRNELTQKIQIVYAGAFNLARIVVAIFRVNMWILVGSSLVQGLAGGLYQSSLKNRNIPKLKSEFVWSKFVRLVKAGAFLNVILFLTVAQARILSAIVVEKMSRAEFGNFQLIVKLVEPATSIGAVIFAANYTVLAHTLKSKREDFKKRFLKISLLACSVAVFCGVVIGLFPKKILLTFFGSAYASGIELLWLGVGIIIANVILTTSVQYDVITDSYRTALFKYVAILAGYILYLNAMATVSLSHAVILQAVVPLVFVAVFGGCRMLSVKLGKK